MESGHNTFWKCYAQGAPRNKQYRCSFRGAPKISRKNDFYTLILGDENKTTRIRTLHVWKLLYTGCTTNGAISQFLSRSTQDIKKKRLSHIHFRWNVARKQLELGHYTSWTCYICREPKNFADLIKFHE